MTRFLIPFAISLAMMINPAFANDYFISDDLFTYMHTGPGSNYRIIGSVDAGTKITITNTNKDSGYSQIRDNKNRTGWVESKYVTTTQGLKTRLPALEAELKKVKSALMNEQKLAELKNNDLIESLKERTTQVTELEQHTSDLNQKLNDAHSEIRTLSALIDTQKDDVLIRYFSYGGLVAGIGLLFGLILPHILPRRKKSNSGWA